MKKAEAQGIDLTSGTENNINKFAEFVNIETNKIREENKLLDEEGQQYLNVEIEKVKEFLGKMTTINSEVIYDITSRMQEFFINDILVNSQGKGEPRFSNKGENLFDKMRKFSYIKFVQYTKWDYQAGTQPQAAKELIDICAESLIKSGAIRNKFYDMSIRRSIQNGEAKSLMKVKNTNEQEYERYKKQIGISSFKSPNHVYTGNSKQMHKFGLFRKVNSYVQKTGESFAIKYMNVYEAVETTVQMNVEQALSKNPELKEFLQDFQQEEIQKIQQKMIKKYGSLEEAEKHKEEFVNEEIKQQRQDMERKMAIQLSIDYISGMTDRSFNDLAIRTGYMKKEDIETSHNNGRGSKPSQSVAALIKKNEQEEQKKQKEPER